jgi:hypothetical protein
MEITVSDRARKSKTDNTLVFHQVVYSLYHLSHRGSWSWMLITDKKGSGRGLIESHTRLLQCLAGKNKKIKKVQIVSGAWVQNVDFLIRSRDIKLSRTKLYHLASRNYVKG